MTTETKPRQTVTEAYEEGRAAGRREALEVIETRLRTMRADDLSELRARSRIMAILRSLLADN